MVFFHCYIQREEFTSEPALLKKLCSAIREGVTVDNSCDLFTAVNHLYGEDIEEDPLLEEHGEKLVEVHMSRFLLLNRFSSLKLQWCDLIFKCCSWKQSPSFKRESGPWSGQVRHIYFNNKAGTFFRKEDILSPHSFQG